MSEQSEYFLKSQQIKQEIESDSDLIKRIALCFSGDVERFAYGTNNEIFDIGKTKSGIYVALRKGIWWASLDNSISKFNDYCQNAELMADIKAKSKFDYTPRSLNFCIGVVFNSELAGVITEDISEGNKYKLIEANRFMVLVQKERSKVDKVLVDLDGISEYYNYTKPPNMSDYFSLENRLNIKNIDAI